MKQVQFFIDGREHWANVSVVLKYVECSDGRDGINVHGWSEVEDFYILDCVDDEGEDVEITQQIEDAIGEVINQYVV